MNKITCTKCHFIKALNEFSNSKKGKFGKTSVCKECHHNYYLKNKTTVLANVKKRRSTKIGRQNERRWQRERRRKHPEKRILQEAGVRARKKGQEF